MNELSNNERREWAQLLYTRYDLSIKEVALQTGAPEAELRQWISEGNWDGLRRSLLTSRRQQLEILYDTLETLTAQAKTKAAAEQIDPKSVDLIIKYTAAIKNLETETSIGDMIDVMKPFIVWLMKRDLELAKKLTVYFDMYIKEKMKEQ